VPVVRFPSLFARLLAAALVSSVVGCGSGERAAYTRATAVDDFGDTLAAGAAPQRIVSLNPATTELLFAIGAGSRVVGRTSYDMWPEAARGVADLGPGMRPNVEAVLATRPDLVILYASEDNRDAARRLRASGIRTVAFRNDHIADLARVTHALGLLTGDTSAARVMVDSVTATLDSVRRVTSSLSRPTVFWPLWESPLMSVGGGSFLNELVQIAGGRNVFDSLPQPSPTVTFEELVRRDPDIVLAGVNQRRRLMADPKWQTLRAVRAGRVFEVDSSLVMRPASRLGEGARSLARILHPEAGR
jgi:ABC-type Fe3+-hydroxamate transport system substrate-binding protein